MYDIDQSKTLDQLEGVEWGPPQFDSSLVAECHRLRKVPLKDFTVENFRILILQQISLLHLVPLALDILADNPLAEGNCYKGDLLAAIVRIDEKFWRENPELHSFVVYVKNELEIMSATIRDELWPQLEEFNY